MEKDIKFEHNVTLFPKRIEFWGLGVLILFGLFFTIFWFDNSEQKIVSGLVISSLLVVAYLLLIWKSRYFIAELRSDSKNVLIKYYKGKREYKMESPLNDISIVLKNTTTKFGFDCELWLKVGNKKFIIDDTFDWSLLEMKDLFKYIKHFKGEVLSEKEKDMLRKVEEKWKKR